MMHYFRHAGFLSLLAAALACLPACGDGDDGHKDHVHKDDGHKDDDHEGEGGDDKHVHESGRGGVMVELGDHFAQLDFVLDEQLGAFSMYIMDAHAENPVRIEQQTVEIEVHASQQSGAKVERDLMVTLRATADENTGDKVGDSSHFQAPLAELKGRTQFDAVVKSITVKGRTFTGVLFKFAPRRDR